MSRRTKKAIGTLVVVLMAATLAPSASLAYRDSRSQDALDAARSLPPDQLVVVSERLRSTSPDLRAQDALDAARSLSSDQLVAVSERLRSTRPDLRAQDALDAARSLPPDQLVAVSRGLRPTASEPAIVGVVQSDEFNWSSAVMGAAGVLGLIGVSLAVLSGVRQIRRRPARA